MNKISLLLILMTTILAACGAQQTEDAPGANNMMMQQGEQAAGRMNMMRMMHHGVQVPDEYADLTNPVPANVESLSRGAAIFNTQCSSCHGDGGMGDGPAAAALDPYPSPIAHTSQMTGDDYLFWRISEGGIAFETGMPAFKALEEGARWDVINYVRALGKGEITPGQGVGGDLYDPGAELEERSEMLAQAVDLGVLTKAQADTFASVHLELDQQLAAEGGGAISGNADDILAGRLAKLVAAGAITQDQADTFAQAHENLLQAGLMR